MNNVQVDNFGYYECFGENTLGIFSDFIYLDIEARIPFKTVERNDEKDEGRSLIIITFSNKYF